MITAHLGEDMGGDLTPKSFKDTRESPQLQGSSIDSNLKNFMHYDPRVS